MSFMYSSLGFPIRPVTETLYLLNEIDFVSHMKFIHFSKMKIGKKVYS